MVDLQKLRADLLSPEFRLSDLKLKTTSELNLLAIDLLQRPDPLDARDVNDLGLLLNICNILYNNTDMDPLPIEDGVYDLLLEANSTVFMKILSPQSYVPLSPENSPKEKIIR